MCDFIITRLSVAYTRTRGKLDNLAIKRVQR